MSSLRRWQLTPSSRPRSAVRPHPNPTRMPNTTRMLPARRFNGRISPCITPGRSMEATVLSTAYQAIAPTMTPGTDQEENSWPVVPPTAAPDARAR